MINHHPLIDLGTSTSRVASEHTEARLCADRLITSSMLLSLFACALYSLTLAPYILFLPLSLWCEDSDFLSGTTTPPVHDHQPNLPRDINSARGKMGSPHILRKGANKHNTYRTRNGSNPPTKTTNKSAAGRTTCNVVESRIMAISGRWSSVVSSSCQS